jgi:DNA-binding transcriptional regulator YhcF (GntR family)
MSDIDKIRTIFKIDSGRKEPKSKQIMEAVIEGIRTDILKIGESLPSLNDVSFEFDVSKDTVQRAYIGLRDRGIIESVQGKGFYVKAKSSENPLEILLVFNKLTAYKKTIYNAFMHTMNTRANIDLHVHEYDPLRFENIISCSLDRYDYYVIMPFFFDYSTHVIDTFKLIPKHKLVLVNKDVSFLEPPYPVIYEDFENDIKEALGQVVNEIREYHRIVLIFPLDPMSNREIITGFEMFCKQNQLPYDIILGNSDLDLKEKDLYIIIDDDDLAEFIKICREKPFGIGSDIGIISYNETVLKEVLAEGITVISTDFKYMGESLAQMILSKENIKMKNPFHLIRRKSF